MEISFQKIPDPDGHHPTLRLQGDWLITAVRDGPYTGYGEASHSGNDVRCQKEMKRLFNSHIRGNDLSMDSIQQLESSVFAAAPDFVTATAISALNQASYDLLAKKNGAPVWKLFRQESLKQRVPFYATINRALRSRTIDEYLRIIKQAAAIRVERIKCAPFEAVKRGLEVKEQVQAAGQGLAILKAIRSANLDLSIRVDFHNRFHLIRVDFHNRFHLDAFLDILPELEDLKLEWIEEPCQQAANFRIIRDKTAIPLAAGELHFGAREFIRLMDDGFADVIMPDVKHVGGFGPLLTVCREAEKRGVQVSPHNPSGPIACAASIQAAALSNAVTSVEAAFLSSGKLPLGNELVQDGYFHVPSRPGWGVNIPV
jgi:galactonate dehydratase